MIRRFALSLFAVILIAQPFRTYAHQPGLSAMDWTIETAGTNATITFALRDIEIFMSRMNNVAVEAASAERETAKSAIAELLAERLCIEIDGEEQRPRRPWQLDFDDRSGVRLTLSYSSVPTRSLRVKSGILALLPDGHQQYITVKDAAGRLLFEKMLRKTDGEFEMNVIPAEGGGRIRSVPSGISVFTDFFELGVEHILTGYDHLLFLFALLAVTHGFRQALATVTVFTVAHSMTLACATLNIVTLPDSLVEPAIALTIVYTAAENLVHGGRAKGRQWLAFCFGLVHGFGFAGALREMGIAVGETGILLPLFSFNLGIEIGQIAVASVVLPLIWWANDKLLLAPTLLKGCSLSVCLMGAYWLAERTVAV